MTLTPELEQELNSLLTEYAAVFAPTPPSSAEPLPCPLILEFAKDPPRFFRNYRHPHADVPVIMKTIQELLALGKIRKSPNPHCTSPIFLVRAANKEPRLVFDLTTVNDCLQIPSQRPLPDLMDVITTSARKKYFATIDLRRSYNQLPLRNHDQATFLGFAAPDGTTFEWLFAPFGLSASANALEENLAALLADVRDFIARFADDLTIHADTPQEVLRVLRQVLAIFARHGLLINPRKSVLLSDSVQALGFQVKYDCISIIPDRITAIVNFPTPTTVLETQRFLGMVNFIRRFIPQLRINAQPLQRLTHKNVEFTWAAPEQAAFDAIRAKLLSPAVLAPVIHDGHSPIFLFTDASDLGAGATILQARDQTTKVIGYFSHVWTTAEARLPTYAKELAAVTLALRSFYFDIIYQPIISYIDNAALTKALTNTDKGHPSRRIAHILAFLCEFPNLHFKWIAGEANGAADCLSRGIPPTPAALLAHPDIEPLPTIPLFMTTTTTLAPSLDAIRTSAAADPAYQELIKRVSNPNAHPIKRNYTIDNGILYIRTHPLAPLRLVIPNDKELRRNIIDQVHCERTAAHPGHLRTHAILAHHVYWDHMSKDCKKFVNSCPKCNAAKHSHERKTIPYPLQPTPRPWGNVIIDTVTGLLPSGPFNAILSCICTFSKAVMFLPITVNFTASQMGELLAIEFIRRSIGVPASITSDRGPQFTSAVFHALCSALGIKISHSTSNSPQSQGQLERVHSSLGDHLRIYTDTEPRWHLLLDSFAFALNSRVHPGLDFSPFQVWMGYNPTSPAEASVAALPKPDHTASISLRDHIQNIHDIHTAALDNLGSYNLSRILASEPVAPLQLAPDDLVFVHRTCIVPQRLLGSKGFRKSSAVYHGPYRVIEVHQNSATIQLPAHVRAHNRINFRFLKKYVKDPDYHPPTTTPPTSASIPEEYYVDKILRHRNIASDPEFLVLWKDYPASESTWEKVSSFVFPDNSVNPVLLAYIAKKKIKLTLPDPQYTPSDS